MPTQRVVCGLTTTGRLLFLFKGCKMTGTSGRSGGSRVVSVDRTLADGLPELPMGQSNAFNSKWSEVLSQLPKDALRKIDVHQLAILCHLLNHAEQLAALLESDPSDHKARRLFLQTGQSVNRLSAQFGLSIADRSRLNIEPQREKDVFEEFLERRASRRA